MWLPMGPHPNGFFVLGLPSGSPEIAKVETPATLGATLGPHNFACRPQIKMRFKAKL